MLTGTGPLFVATATSAEMAITLGVFSSHAKAQQAVRRNIIEMMEHTITLNAAMEIADEILAQITSGEPVGQSDELDSWSYQITAHGLDTYLG